MTVSERIINLVKHKTKGLVVLTPGLTKEIIDIVINNGETAFVKMYRHEISTWRLIRQIPTTDEEINKQIMKALESKPVENCYKFECFGSDGRLQGQIFTMNSALF